MSKDNLNEDNRKKLRETAQRLGISEDEVFKQIPDIILLGAVFNPKQIGGFLKRMQPDITSSKVLKKQIADDSFGSVLLGFFNKPQENSSQQQEATSSAVSCEVSKDDSKKSDEVSNSLTEVISIKQLETSSAASCQDSTLGGWSNDNKELLETIATLSQKSKDEVLNENPLLNEDLPNPELKEYLEALIESLTINDSCTNDNPPNDVAAGSSHEMSNVASCALTGENPPFNEDCN
ncbi:hypothetical protein [Candidatus Tisiphia endosymbiont of Melanophora roralis]|uniref:hypothetical protein n=1 Tax=Candidatus Tisiphia endosymbiont of Melanophora roralis TaxID=3066261 RepID=UPI001E6CD54E|nr:MAG: hypothetical protein LF884_01115 [Rickettsia endosymbiont of Cimex lectularius]